MTMNGKITNLVAVRGYGYIRANQQEYFFHMEDYEGTWTQLLEDYVEFGKGKIDVNFEPVMAPKGPRARHVMKVIPTNNFPNEPGRSCGCLISDRQENESQREWLKRCMCIIHWMQTEHYHAKLATDKLLGDHK